MGFFKFINIVIFGNPKQKPQIDISEPEKKFEINSGNPVKAWKENQDVIHRLRFSSTMQLRNPLRIIKRHGEIHSDINTEPPHIANEMWQGIWIPKGKTWHELGLDIDDMPEGTTASHIGQIKSSDYLPFLIAVREIVESNESIDNRISAMRNKIFKESWTDYIARHGGIDEIINQFFPRFIDNIPKLNKMTIDELYKLGIVTANKLEATSDSALMAINGIGNAKLRSMRDYCASITKNRDDDRLDNVTK